MENNDLNKEITPQKDEKDTDKFENEVLGGLPPEVKKVVEMGLSFQRFSGNLPNPLHDKITDKHISQILSIAEKEEDNSYKDAQSSKKYSLVYYISSIVFLVFLIIYLSDKNSSLLLNIIEKATYIFGGGGLGFGLKAYFDNKKQK